MGLIRRVYLFLITVTLIAAIVILLLSPQTVTSWSATISEQSVIARIILAALAGIVLFALTYLQVRPDRREKATGLMMRASGAITEVSVESARERILKVVGAVSGVVSVDAQVRPVRGRADVELQVTVTGDDTALPAKQKEINRALSQVVDKQLGLQMAGHPRVKIQLEHHEVLKIAIGALPPIQETVKPAQEQIPATKVKDHPGEKKSLLDWLGMSGELDKDKSDDETIREIPSTEKEKLTKEPPEKKPDQPDDVAPLIDSQSNTGDSKTLGTEAS